MTVVSRDYEPGNLQLQFQVSSPTLTIQVLKTGSWNSELVGIPTPTVSQFLKKTFKSF